MYQDQRRTPSRARASQSARGPLFQRFALPPLLPSVAREGTEREGPWRALRCFGGQPEPLARREAAALLRRPPACACCASILGHVQLRLGTTLYYDDDPAQLTQAFPPAERGAFNPRVLAACVLLTGRPRVELYPR